MRDWSVKPLATVLGFALLLSACDNNNNNGSSSSSSSSSSGGSSSSSSSSSSGSSSSSSSGAAAVLLPTGQSITPTAAAGSSFQPLNPGLKDFPDFTVGHAMSEALSPDGKTLLILTSGYNLNTDAQGSTLAADSSEYVFVFDVSGAAPAQKQVLQVPNSYGGIAFAPDGGKFYVAGGVDDNVHTYALASGQWAASGSAIALNNSAAAADSLGGKGNGLKQAPVAAGVAVTADGKRLVVANQYNDSISLVDLSLGAATSYDLRPGKSGGTPGTPGGENPFGVAIVGSGTAYVSSERDREIVVVDISAALPLVKARIPVQGNPNKLVLNKAQTLLYVAADNADAVSVIDTAKNTVIQTLPTVAPPGLLSGTVRFRGAAPNSLALSPDETTLYVTNGGTNSVAVIALGGTTPGVTGLIPTGWYPQAVVASASTLYVVNSKSQAGPDPGTCYGYGASCLSGSPVKYAPNEYVLQLEKAGFLTIPVPNATQLATLTSQVAANDGVGYAPSAQDAAVMQALHDHIKHVIYIVKENRTYDQVLGDLGKGNGDPSLVEFGAANTPNLHAAASGFVTFDNFYDSGEVSGNGWAWSTSARETDVGVKTIPLNYSGRGAPYDTEGTNRNVNVGLSGTARSSANPLTPADPDLLPGTGNVAAPDGPEGEVQQGYLWNAALRAGLSVRNYGFFCDLSRYSSAVGPLQIPKTHDPHASNTTVAYAANADLAPLTDPYFRGYDNAFPDFYREQEWEREFAGFVTDGKLPALSLVRFMHDHTGAFSSAIDGVNTPQTQVADNDYAVGKLLQALANSPYKSDTLVFIVEDDAQDGPDHVDAHRSIGFVVGPYVKQGGLVSTHYSTVNMLRTIEDVLGIDHLSVYDAFQAPMTDAFDPAQASWSYTATVPAVLASTQLPVSGKAALLKSAQARPTHPASWWIARTRGMDFSVEDRLDAVKYNRLLWQGIKGRQPYPAVRSGKDLRQDRQQLLDKAGMKELAMAGAP